MPEYNNTDLNSTLKYIKERFGFSAFTTSGRLAALVSDLAPGLKSERVMLERMSRLGIVQEIAQSVAEDAGTKQRIIQKSMTVLTNTEYIRPAIAAEYLKVLVSVFDFGIEVVVPKESNVEKMKFDLQRYLQESQDRDFIMAQKAYTSEDYVNAQLLYSKAYGKGNVLAGVCLGALSYSGTGCPRDYSKAVRFFVDGMERRCPLGAEWLAEAYRNGKGVPKDKEKANEIYDSCVEALEKMCAAGCKEAQYVYGFDLLYGSYSEVNENKAYFWLEKAMKAGYVSAGVEVAKIYIYGWGKEKDEKKGVELLESYSYSGNKKAHFELGKLYYLGKAKEQNYQEAKKHFLISAQKGHATSQSYLGDIFYYGYGTTKDYQGAKRWYDLAAEQGSISANRSLGFMYLDGQDVGQDKDKAFGYFKFAADNGDACSQYMLHIFYFGDEKYQDYSKGKEYLEKSSEQGYILAQKYLAKCLVSASFMDEDDQEFVFWIKKAAEQGDAEAQRILGEAYIRLENEAVLPVSVQDALNWLNKAAEQKDIEAYTILASILLPTNMA